jgi:pilus assembly protein CpaC
MSISREEVAKTVSPQEGHAMKSRILKHLLAAACAAASLAHAAPAAAQTVTQPVQSIDIGIGNGQLITVPGTMTDVFVSNEAVADVQVKSQRQLYLFGKAGGTTTIYASNSAGAVIWSATVRVGSNLDSVDSMLRLAMPEAKIAVSTMGTNSFLLTGTVAAPEDGAEAERLVKAYVGGDSNVISRLRMATPLQVNLQVRFAEVSRSLVKQMGSNLVTRDLTGGFTFGLSRGRVPGTIGPRTLDTTQFPMLDASEYLNDLYGLELLPESVQLPFDPRTGQFVFGGTSYNIAPSGSANVSTLGLAGKLAGVDILSALDIGEQIGLVTTLSQPNLTALSGETANFLAGGEFPIPVSQGLGATAIEYKNYGVSLSYTPTVLADGRISMRVRPEVSELSAQGAVTLSGFTIPALTTRRAETTIELGSGQSFMIAGLMSNNSNNTIEKTPGAGDIPILGSLFRSTNFQRGETELVIVVTPYLVKPVSADEIALPTDGYNAPNELQRILGNMEADGHSREKRPGPTTAPDQTGAAPGLGALTPPPAAETRRQARSASTEPVAPGFSLK